MGGMRGDETLRFAQGDQGEVCSPASVCHQQWRVTGEVSSRDGRQEASATDVSEEPWLSEAREEVPT